MPSRSRSSESKSQHGDGDEAPGPIAACFIVEFDQRAGYTITWSRSTPGLELDGVEYKCFPSGLHNVQEDIIYFLQADHVGLCIYRQRASSQADRNASFLALGVLAPQARDISKIWLHADPLLRLSEKLLVDIQDTAQLEAYWESHQPSSPKRRRSSRPQSRPSDSVDSSLFNPLTTMPDMLDDLGPLIFPLWRAALLRERILILKQPPVRSSCEMAYILSTFAALPSKLSRHLPVPTSSRITPTFSIGLHEIPDLEGGARQAARGEPVRQAEDSDGMQVAGWIACSSDKLLETKPTLSSIRVNMESHNGRGGPESRWPDVVRADDTKVQATQRDLRRYIALQQALASLRSESFEDEDGSHYEAASDRQGLLRKPNPKSFDIDVPNEHEIVEPQSLALMAYNGWAWWASAGERASELQDEYDNDADLLLDAEPREEASGYSRRRRMSGHSSASLDSSPEAVASALLAYFERMTVQVMTVLKDVVSSSGMQAPPEQRVQVFKDDLTAMGIDPWSPNDRLWVAKMIKVYFGRDADIQGGSIECCGVKIY